MWASKKLPNPRDEAERWYRFFRLCNSCDRSAALAGQRIDERQMLGAYGALPSGAWGREVHETLLLLAFLEPRAVSKH